ncbi:RmlC-like cupin domain-containing protein [Cercophora newfieldiana]|uniref:RmlC-like cupin domain-containing protein n=1 Tax=Cercophora newfieldiana TaxID=92897 RepID=A0AA39YSM0_9PEZI|nr:RmlC-like cupin domain-containing protein [Cercophora newfieldiana]
MLTPSSLTLLLLGITPIPTLARSLWLQTTPQSPVPYALKKGAGIALGGGNTFPVTGNSSGNAFCILHTNAAGSYASASGVFPHVHKKTYENFYAVKGRVQLWGQNLDTYLANTSVQETRILSQGDIGAIPWNTIHTFTLLEPDTQLTGVLVPGGFEEFFFNMNLSPSGGGGTLPGAGGFDNEGLAKWDVYPQLDFVPRRDVVNGKGGGTGNWYTGPNPLPGDAKAPIWVAKNYGPKYLSETGGRYQIVAPFVTGTHTNGTFSQGTLTISPFFSGASGANEKIKSTVATAFMVEEGQLEVAVEGYDEPAVLIDGDVIFVPANTSFSYAATAEFTKFMYVTGGGQGLDKQLMDQGRSWNSAFYPARGPTSRPMMRI